MVIAIKKAKTIEDEINLNIIPLGLEKPKRVVIQIIEKRDDEDTLCQYLNLGNLKVTLLPEVCL